MKPCNDVKFIAFYLPQFHPFIENDLWWGKGFTEWTNVTKAGPVFKGHYQPHLPTDFGFYDLRVPETRREQAHVAREFGIDGFCYHFYWFSGKRLMERPIDEMLADSSVDMPFCLCWANENWTRAWNASDQDILIEQLYKDGHERDFIADLAPFFSDPRYIKVDGKPLLVVYRPQHMPDPKSSAKKWNIAAQQLGFPGIYTCAALTHNNETFSQFGFDCALEFPPHNAKVQNLKRKIRMADDVKGSVVEFGEIASYYLSKIYEDEPVIKTVFPSWDNTARKPHSPYIVLNGSPENYEYWLKCAAEVTPSIGEEKNRFVFINAWNEWAEGCHLEPDRRFARGFLEATKCVKEGSRASRFQHGLPNKETWLLEKARKRSLLNTPTRVWKEVQRFSRRINRTVGLI